MSAISSSQAADTAPPVATRAVWDGFEVCQLRNHLMEVVVVPELGAKVVSLKNRLTGREWMYHAGNGTRPKLFRNRLGDDFARGPVAGWDECLPTISPCVWRGRNLPDHGEVWSAAWQWDATAWAQGRIKTSVRLPVSPFEFTREIGLRAGTLEMRYHLKNLDETPQEFLWAMHPLLALQPDDRLLLTSETRQQLPPQPWMNSLHFPEGTPACLKSFAGPLTEGRVGVVNPATGDGLVFTWDTAAANTLGLWLTRGGWHGHHHLALEPANGAPDSLAAAVAEGKRCGILAPGGEMRWSVQLRLQADDDGWKTEDRTA